MSVHPSAIVHPSARIDSTAEVGPFCSIGEEVSIGARSKLMAHVYVEGPTTIGEDNVFFPYSTVGVAPQDLKYHGERAETRIGHRNSIREFVTIHRGTEGGGALTSIGDDTLNLAVAPGTEIKVARQAVVRVVDRTPATGGQASEPTDTPEQP